MKAINHLVLAGRDLEAMRAHYASLGFTVTPRGQHPFGNGATRVQDVWIVGDTAPKLAGFLQTVTGAKAVTDNSGAILPMRTGAIVLARPAVFESAFGLAPPHPDDGPHLAAFTIACQTL